MIEESVHFGLILTDYKYHFNNSRNHQCIASKQVMKKLKVQARYLLFIQYCIVKSGINTIVIRYTSFITTKFAVDFVETLS